MGLESGIREHWRPAGGLHDDGLIHSPAGRRRSQEGNKWRRVGLHPNATHLQRRANPVSFLKAAN